MKSANRIVNDILSNNRENNLHYPKPEYNKCNKGHTLVEVWNEQKQHWDWDCPTCIKIMEKARRR